MAGTSFNISPDAPIILRLTLPDNDSSKFVRAILRNQNGAALVGSPFVLLNLGDGRYFFKDEIGLQFPSSAIEVSALYQIFDDADFLIPTVDYSFQNEDVFRKAEAGTVSVADVSGAIIELSNAVNKVLTLQTDIEVEIQNDNDLIEAEIEE